MGDINDSLANLASKYIFSTGERKQFEQHRNTILNCLKNGLPVKKYFYSGSYGNSTEISGHSDADLFVVFDDSFISRKNSDNILDSLRRQLNTSLPDSKIKKDKPSVRVEFSSGCHIEVTPAEDWYTHYKIPYHNNRWVKTCPDKHNDWIQKLNGKLDNKLKKLIRLLKIWKYKNNVPISSFYLELFAANKLKNEPCIIYNIDLRNVFGALKALPEIEDSTTDSMIQPCSCNTNFGQSRSKINTAYKYISDENWDAAFNYELL